MVWTELANVAMCVSLYVLRQTKTYLLENVRVVVGKACEDDIKCDVIPLLVSGLDTGWPPCHIAAISAVSVMSQCLDANMMRRYLLPPAKTLFSQSASIKVSRRDRQEILFAVHTVLTDSTITWTCIFTHPQ